MQTIVFQGPDGSLQLNADMTQQTIWADQSQIADIFGIDRSVISKHIKNIFGDSELQEDVVCAYFAHTTPHGATTEDT